MLFIVLIALVLGTVLSLDVLVSEHKEAAAFRAVSVLVPSVVPSWTPKALPPRAVRIDPSAAWLQPKAAPRHRSLAPAN